MKKTLLLLLTLAFAMVANGQRLSMNPRLSSQPVKGKYEFRTTHKSTQRDGKMATLQQRKAPARVDIIFDQPEGELKIYERSGGAMYNYWGYLFTTYQDGDAMQMVFADDGKTVYLQDPISQAAASTWVRAELSDDGKTLTMPLNQHIIYYDEVEYGMITAWVDITVGDDGYIVATPNHDIIEAARYVEYLKKGGLLITNLQQINPMPVITGDAEYPEELAAKLSKLDIVFEGFDALSVARQAGSVKAVNLALLGKLSGHFDFTEEQWLDTISTSVPEKFIEMNKKAFLLGRNS